MVQLQKVSERDASWLQIVKNVHNQTQNGYKETPSNCIETQNHHKEIPDYFRDIKQLQTARLLQREICSLFLSGCLAPVYWMESITCLCPGASFLIIHSRQGESVAYTDTVQHDKWPWKWISAFPSTSLKQVKTHTIAISPSSGFHYTLVSSVLFWQPVCAVDVMRNVNFYTGYIAYRHCAALSDTLPHSHNLDPTWNISICPLCSLLFRYSLAHEQAKSTVITPSRS